MKKKSSKMSPKHTVNVTFKAWDIAKAGAGVTLRIRSTEGLLGTIEIGQGTFGWKAANKQSFRRISWTTLATRLNAK